MVVKTIVHFEIPAANAEELSRFYRRVFGWKFDRSPMPGMEYWLISTGPQGRSVTGGMYAKMGPDDRPRNFVQVEEIDSAIAEFKTAGGREVVGKMEVPDRGWSFIGADPEGNPIAMFEPKMPTPRPARRSRAKPRRRAKSARSAKSPKKRRQ